MDNNNNNNINNNVNDINIYTEYPSSLLNQNTQPSQIIQSQPQPSQTPIPISQYIPQNNELASPSSLPPNYNDIDNDDLVIELKRPAHSINANQNDRVVIKVENSDQYVM